MGIHRRRGYRLLTAQDRLHHAIMLDMRLGKPSEVAKLRTTKRLHPGPKYLTNPSADIHGTKMVISVPNAEDRQNVIAYLKTMK